MKGFTLVEMLIVVAILVFLTSFLVTSNKSGQEQIALFKEEARLIGVLNQAKSLTLEKKGEACGFGVNFPAAPNDGVRREFILFQDNPPVGKDCPGDGKYGGGSEKIKSFSLDARVFFVSPPSDSEVIFIAPYLETNLSSPFNIILETLDGKQAEVYVNPGGQVGAVTR